MHRRASVLRTAQGIFASLPAAALLPGGPRYFTVSTVEKRATVVAVDVYGCFKLLVIVVVRPAGHRRSGRRSVHGESENGRTSSRVESSTG